MPTLRGYIEVVAMPGSVEVSVPCNTKATLCAPRSALDGPATLAETALLLDGEEVPAVLTGGHLCAQRAVSCGSGGAPRRLLARPRSQELLV